MTSSIKETQQISSCHVHSVVRVNSAQIVAWQITARHCSCGVTCAAPSAIDRSPSLHTGHHVTLRELLQRHPNAFYPQAWYLDEPFMDAVVPNTPVDPPTDVAPGSLVSSVFELPHVATLALCYVCNPLHPCWQRYLWCRDTDMQGQRVYVGTNGRGLEIHRHLHLTSRWGIATWKSV